VESKNAQLDISFNATEYQRKIVIGVIYCTQLYKKETIQRLMDFFHHVLRLAIDDITVKINDIGLPHELEPANAPVNNEADTDFEFN
jgi:hypothetical protein